MTCHDGRDAKNTATLPAMSTTSALMLTLTAIVFGAVLAFNRLRGAVAW